MPEVAQTPQAEWECRNLGRYVWKNYQAISDANGQGWYCFKYLTEFHRAGSLEEAKLVCERREIIRLQGRLHQLDEDRERLQAEVDELKGVNTG